jgi:hypothetical protein
MASTTKKKRTKARSPRPPTARNNSLKALIKEAVREVLQEERAAHAAEQQSLAATSRDELVALALQALGSWQESEGPGNSVELVRRLRDDWKHRPS